MTRKPRKMDGLAKANETFKANVTKNSLRPKPDTDSRSTKLERTVVNDLVRVEAVGSIAYARKAKKLSKAAEKRAARVKSRSAAKSMAKIMSPDAGRGNLSAEGRKSLNPQPILNKKAEIAKKAGGKFYFNRTGRVWSLITSAGADLTLTAKEVAALSYDEFTTACKLGRLPISGEKLGGASTR